MQEMEVIDYVRGKARARREDIARAKEWILSKESFTETILTIVDEWLTNNSLEIPKKIDMQDPRLMDLLDQAAETYSMRMAFYQGIWELVAASELLPGPVDVWESLALNCSSPGRGFGIDVKLKCPYPRQIYRLSQAASSTSDPDILLSEVDCATLHPGILEGIKQSLNCYRRGLYMPAVAMLAAAVEACWTECGRAVATKVGSSKLANVIANSGFGKIVAEVSTVLQQENAKAIREASGQNAFHVRDAEVWTTLLRDRRNALHWDKKNSFIVEHSETAVILLAAPIHIRTLEAIRNAC